MKYHHTGAVKFWYRQIINRPQEPTDKNNIEEPPSVCHPFELCSLSFFKTFLALVDWLRSIGKNKNRD